MEWDLTSLSTREGLVDWRAGHVLGGTDLGAGEYAGDRTIDPSVLGGGGSGNSADMADEYANSPDRQIRGDGGAERAVNEGDVMDDEEEEDVVGILFENASDNDLLPPSGLGKGKGKGKGLAVVVGLPNSLSPAAAAGSRIRKKSWRKALADGDEVVVRYNDKDGYSDGESGEDVPRAHPISAPAVLGAQRMKRRLSSLSSLSSSSVHTFCHHCRTRSRRPKMRCTLINQTTRA